ncbi:glycosyl hydrolase 115 family protein [Bacteroidales bacterium OttesenSCG-928-L03]|nr:glycosyl hydrolase 115 family protein [Bacteroidales bacterium OttesenSCG-928-L03]
MRTPGILLLTIILCLAFSASAQTGNGKFQVASPDKVVDLCLASNEDRVVHTAVSLLQEDIEHVSGQKPGIIHKLNAPKAGNILLGTLGKSKLITSLIKQHQIDIAPIQGQWEAFLIQTIEVNNRPTLLIIGSDDRGTAYGIMELSRLIGVSPWHYFADVPVKKQTNLALDPLFLTHSPSVQYRGIFINDEDWGLMPWASQTLDPEAGKGVIGPRANEKIFELLLRLRANTYWPAMHECSVPFFLIEGNKAMAEKYGIYIGTSHCEPMACNVNGEWKVRGQGQYNYLTNRDNINRFFETRVRETSPHNTIYTLGLRGVHDGAMEGAKTVKEQQQVLSQVLQDQRNLLAKLKKEKLQDIPQVFIPYKEVLDVYNSGLQVPEDVTLMWCDDNYGYIRHFPTPEEQARPGGNGVYYHISYWGRPHDYLWLSTTHPALIYNQMRTAYDSGIQKMWIVNVGDIKPGEYLMNFFLDMAWDIEAISQQGVNQHLTTWLGTIFGTELAEPLAAIQREYYRLAYIRKPEFMGNTRCEEKQEPLYNVVHDLPFTDQEIKQRLANYELIAQQVRELEEKIAPEQADAWFQLIAYPVLAANEMNKKHLIAQLARRNKGNWQRSHEAYESILVLTHTYNNVISDGKWRHIMDPAPRKLSTFRKITPENSQAIPQPVREKPLFLFNGTDYSSSQGSVDWAQGIGYEEKAVQLAEQAGLNFAFSTQEHEESVLVELRLVPNHPVNNRQLRVEVSADNGTCAIPIAYHTQGRSEEWKQNVLTNQAVRRFIIPLSGTNTKHTLKIKALDPGVILDQVLIKKIEP